MHSDAVGIRIGSNDQVRVFFRAQLIRKGKGLFCFRVRITHGRKIAVGRFLLRYNAEAGKAKAA